MKKINSTDMLRVGMRIRYYQGETWWEGRIKDITDNETARFVISASSRDVNPIIGTTCMLPIYMGETFVIDDKLQLF